MPQISSFALRLPGRVRFGRNASQDVVPEIAALGSRLLLVHGRSPARASPLVDMLQRVGCTVSTIGCPCEPTLAMLQAILTETRADPPDAVVAIGGGAVLDLGKAVAALVPSSSDPLDHLEGVGQGNPLRADPLPFVAVPTTAGTGSEATKNAVIAVPERRVKVSLRDDRMVPDLAIIDPALMDGTPKSQTLASGMDAVVQVIEPYLSHRANPFSDALAWPAIKMGLEALVTLMETGEDPSAREALAYVAHVSGMALANAGLGAVHGLAGVYGGETGAPHGVICARMLAPVLAELRRGDVTSSTLARLDDVETVLDTTIPGGVDGLPRWMSNHGLPPLPDIDPARISKVARAAENASSMKASPVRFDVDALTRVLSKGI